MAEKQHSGGLSLTSNRTQTFSICFVALNSYSLFERSEKANHIGGAEAQQYEMACYLRDRGHSVTFVVKDHGQPAEVEHDGIRVLKAYNAQSGLPILRFFHPRWSGLAAALKAADSQVYYQRSSGAETGQVGLWCKLNGRRFVYGVASEGDCVAELPFIGRAMDRALFRLGLKLSGRVVAQTRSQQRLLEENFGLQSVVIPNVIRAPEATGSSVVRQSNTVLWVGRIAPVKRVEWIVALARAQPEFQFRLVGGVNQDTSYASQLLSELKELENVTLVESMDRPLLFDEYRRAGVLLLTSKMEGFPNVFIEAWLCGTPVISTFDPDDLVAEHQLGWVAQSQEALSEVLDSGPFESEEHESSARMRVTAYAQGHHAPAVVLPRFEQLLSSLL